jgi:hypothetical protein
LEGTGFDRVFNRKRGHVVGHNGNAERETLPNERRYKIVHESFGSAAAMASICRLLSAGRT